MIVRYFIPLLAVAGVLFALRIVRAGYQKREVPPPVFEPPRAPFERTIAAAGIVEPSSEAIAVSAAVSGMAVEVAVRVGDQVEEGDVLFRVDARDLEAELLVERAGLEASRSRVARLERWPRPEERQVAEARVAAAKAVFENAKQQHDLALSIRDERALSKEERNRRLHAFQEAEALLQQATAELELMQRGTWLPDLEVARAELSEAEARVQAIELEIERRVVRAPRTASVLQINLRPGEYAPAGILARALIVLGDTSTLHVRADVDEHEAWRFRREGRAIACLRGNRDAMAELELVRVEPYVVPKRSLTGESTERVDTRVLQVLFRFDPARLSAYVGQQVDVFIEVPEDSRSPAR